jgi:hypothetical protein
MDTHLHVFDLTAHEQTRLVAVLDSLGNNFDPLAVLEGEREAHAQLYSGLDSEQLAVYQQLVRAGVLDERPLDR